MKKYILTRFLLMLGTIFIIATLTFVLMHLIPGTPFDQERQTSAAVQDNLRAFYKLDQSLPVQYLHYLKAIVTFDYGPSISNPDTTVNTLLARGFPVSFELGLMALVAATLSGIAFGTLAALRHNRLIDRLVMAVAVVGISIPNFVLATLLIQELSVGLGWFPAATWRTPWHKVLPVIALAVTPMAILARITRSSMLDVLTQDYITMARAKGLSPWRVIIRHGLRNALLPVITLLGTLAASILTGTFVIEKIFAIPGMGRYFVDSISTRDYPVIMGTTVFYSAILVFMLFLVDIAYGLLDPRIALHRKGHS